MTRILNIVRLGLFALAYGLTGALVGGTLNRVLIADLGFGAAVVGLYFAAPLLISPVRVWLGYRSDGFPIFGRRREPYVVLGALLAGVGVIASTALALRPGAPGDGLLLGALLLTFLLYGFGRNLGHNTFQALLSDRFKGDQRPRAMTGYEVATLLGLVVGAGALGGALRTFDAGRLMAVTVGAMTIVLVFSLLATLGQEPRDQVVEVASRQARQASFQAVVRDIVWKDPQVRLFFALVLFAFVGTLAQDVLLEPYGALVLAMDVGATTQLTAFWGVGVMISMLLAGAVLIQRLGTMRVLRLGLVMSMVVFAGLILTGATGNAGLFRGLVLVMGLGTGLAGAGMLTIVINFTSTLRAGLLLGVWGVANQLGRAFGSLMGGGVVDAMQSLTGGNALVSYSTVFAIEVVMLAVALALSTRLDLADSRAHREEAEVLRPALAGDGVAGGAIPHTPPGISPEGNAIEAHRATCSTFMSLCP